MEGLVQDSDDFQIFNWVMFQVSAVNLPGLHTKNSHEILLHRSHVSLCTATARAPIHDVFAKGNFSKEMILPTTKGNT